MIAVAHGQPLCGRLVDIVGVALAGLMIAVAHGQPPRGRSVDIVGAALSGG